MVKIISSHTFWISLGSIATFFMVFLTYQLLRYYRKTDKERTLRESVDKIIDPLTRDLEKIIDMLTRLTLSRSTSLVEIGNVWRWPEIKKGNSVLIYRLSKSIKENIEKFHEAFEKFINLYNQQIYPLEDIILEEIRGRLLEEIKKEQENTLLVLALKGHIIN